MSRYLVAVGGTGQHVALAVADYLVLSHAVRDNPLPPLQFFLLDSDPSATQGDQASAWDLALAQLRALHAADPARPAQTKHDNPYPDLPNGVETAHQAVTALLGPSAADLLLAEDERNVLLRQGYFGKPHIAGILTEVLLSRVGDEKVPAQHVIRQLTQALRAESRICLVGSTVGGTGAGVLPRLVEFLAKKNERAQLCANVGLEWFQINPDQGGGARQVQMPTNATASLWHYVRERSHGRYRLVLWGHPAIGQATQEADSGDRFQPVKENLTLPMHAAASSIAFLFDDEVQTREVTPVINTDHVGISRTLDFGQHDLHWLIERNRDLLGRLALLRSYLESPYTGAVVPWLRGTCRIESIDSLPPDAKRQLIDTIDVLSAAKTRALERIARSDERLRIGASIERLGVSTLREYVAGGATIDAITRTLEDVRPLPRSDSPVRLIRSSAMNRQPFPPAPVGTRQPVETGHIDAIAPFDSVEAERVPDIRATERILSTFFQHAVREELVDEATLLRDSQILVPLSLNTTDGDRVEHWVHRWLFLTNALVTGVVTPRALDQPIEDGAAHGITTALYIGDSDRPVGYLSPDLGAVPNFAPFWSDMTRLRSVSSRTGSSGTLATWLQTIEAAALCSNRPRLPQWFKYLLALFREVRRRPRLKAGGTSIPLQFDQLLYVPLPGAAEERASLVESICRAFAIRVESLEMAHPDFAPAERTLWEDLLTRRVPYCALEAGSDESWTTLNTPSELVWSDLLDRTSTPYLFDDVVLYPGRCYGWRRRSTARFVTPADIILDRVAVLVGTDGQRTATVPVKTAYAQVIQNSRQRVHENGSVHVEIRFAGRPTPYTRSFSGDEVIELPRLTLFTWPAISCIGNGTQSVLLTDYSDVQHRIRLIYMADDGTAVVSPVLTQRNSPHYLTPSRNGVTDQMRPKAFSLSVLLPERGGWMDVGYLSPSNTAGPNMAGSETWAVDFGTSSTVIVRKPLGATPFVLKPTADRDSTAVYSCGANVPRKKMLWYHTWDGQKPADGSSNVFPSQLVNIASIRGESLPADQMVFGRDFMIDHGEEFENALRLNVIDNLKWREPAKHRVDYLTHLLEQAITMEIARSRRQQQEFPSELKMVFTLPLRQQSGIDAFAKEIDGIAQSLKLRTGVIITPKYQWESLAVAPPELDQERMIVVADLGGGTLDMYSRYHAKGGQQRQAADSARIGGRFCFSMIADRAGSNINEQRMFLRAAASHREEMVTREPRLPEYFHLVYRYIAMWSTALRKKWSVPENVPTLLQLAGMTWSLPGATSSQANAADILRRISREIGSPIPFMAYERDLVTVADDERKLFLAKSASQYESFDTNQLREAAGRLDFVLGLPVRDTNSQRFDETVNLWDVHPPAKALHVDLDAARRLYPKASEPLLADVTSRLRSALDLRGLGPGGYDTANHRFGVTPLTMLAEVAVEQIAPEAVQRG